MLRHAPVLLQPSFDVENGNGLLCLFYHFTDDNSTVVCSLVYESEASYEFVREHQLNHCGTFCYRSHNYHQFHRTAVHNTTPPPPLPTPSPHLRAHPSHT